MVVAINVMRINYWQEVPACFEHGYPSSVKGGTVIAADVDDSEEHASGSSIQRRTGRRRVVSVGDSCVGMVCALNVTGALRYGMTGQDSHGTQ